MGVEVDIHSESFASTPTCLSPGPSTPRSGEPSGRGPRCRAEAIEARRAGSVGRFLFEAGGIRHGTERYEVTHGRSLRQVTARSHKGPGRAAS
jgi:hypothetical protein